MPPAVVDAGAAEELADVEADASGRRGSAARRASKEKFQPLPFNWSKDEETGMFTRLAYTGTQTAGDWRLPTVLETNTTKVEKPPATRLFGEGQNLSLRLEAHALLNPPPMTKQEKHTQKQLAVQERSRVKELTPEQKEEEKYKANIKKLAEQNAMARRTMAVRFARAAFNYGIGILIPAPENLAPSLLEHVNKHVAKVLDLEEGSEDAVALAMNAEQFCMWVPHATLLTGDAVKYYQDALSTYQRVTKDITDMLLLEEGCYYNGLEEEPRRLLELLGTCVRYAPFADGGGGNYE